MPQDAFTLRYLCEELNEIFSGGKVNKITQPSNDDLVLTIYTGKRTQKLLLNVNPASPRIGVIDNEGESPLTAPNFCMLMRKHLLSATVESISLVGFDRIVKIDLMASAEFFDAVRKTIYVELMGRYSNIILTENGKILGGNRGINMFDNGVRPLIVGQNYVFPPVGEKKLPTDISLKEIFENCQEFGFANLIVKHVQGIALSTAKEIEKAFLERKNSSLNLSDGELAFNCLNDYIVNTKKQPCVLFDDNSAIDVCVYPYQHATKIKQFSTLYEAEEFYFNQKNKEKLFKNKKDRLSSIINTAIKKVKKRLVAISSKEKDAESAEENRIKGELILANVYRIKQGETKCTLDNYYDGTQVEIVLDSRLSPAKNAENYYKKYNKQKRTLIALKPQREQAESELNYYLAVSDEIALCEDINELSFIQAELEKVGLIVERKVAQKKKPVETFCRVYDVFGFKVRAGRNNTENDKLTFTSSPNDVWVHAKDYHSTHVLIETNGKKVPEKVLIVASQICAYYSKGREGGKTEIVYTERKNVKKPPKSKPGFCIYDNFNSITVTPEKHAEFLKTE